MQKKDLDKLPEEDGGRSPGRAAGATTDLHFVHQSARKTTLHKRLVHNIGAQKTGARHNNLCSAPGIDLSDGSLPFHRRTNG